MKKRITNKIEQEKAAREQLELGRLLKKERVPEKKAHVEQILNANSGLARKINAQEDKQSAGNESRGSHDESEAARNRKRLKRQPAAVSFFTYLFYDFPRIREFGRKSHILNTGFFPFSIKLNKSIRKFFIEQLQKRYLAPLISVLNYVEKEGWLLLTKREYNLVLILKRFCRVLFLTNFDLLNFKNPNLIDKLQEPELCFLILYYQPDYIDLIILSIKKVIEKAEKYKKDYHELPVMIKRLLYRDITLPSLYNFFLGLNMLKYKRYLILDQLINREAGHMVSAAEFECTDKIFKKIDVYITGIENSLEPVINRYNEILKIKAFLPPAGSGNKEFELLEYFYNDSNRNPPCLFAVDKSNVIYLTLNLTSKFLAVFTSLLNGHVITDAPGAVEIFSPRFFAVELGKIRTFYDKLEKLSYSLSSLSLERFLDLRISVRSGLTIEVEILQCINEISTLLVDIGKKLAHVVVGRQKVVLKRTENNETLEPEILAGKLFSLPHENRMIESSTVLSGRTVLNALSFTCCICMLCGLFYKNPIIHDLLHNEERITQNIRDRAEVIQRIAEGKRYREIKNKFKL